MTTTPERGDACQRCNTREVTEELPTLTEPHSILRLCDSCYREEMEQRYERFLHQAGGELEAAFREAGTPLADGRSGYDLVRGFAEESHRLAQTPEAQARVAPMRSALERFAHEVAAELPGGTEHPEFPDRLMGKMRAWMEAHGAPGDQASA